MSLYCFSLWSILQTLFDKTFQKYHHLKLDATINHELNSFVCYPNHILLMVQTTREAQQPWPQRITQNKINIKARKVEKLLEKKSTILLKDEFVLTFDKKLHKLFKIKSWRANWAEEINLSFLFSLLTFQLRLLLRKLSLSSSSSSSLSLPSSSSSSSQLPQVSCTLFSSQTISQNCFPELDRVRITEFPKSHCDSCNPEFCWDL